jgi:hypothetical protein
MDRTEKLVKGRLAEGVEPDAIVQELMKDSDGLEAVVTAYVNGFVQPVEPEREQRHSSFRLSR